MVSPAVSPPQNGITTYLRGKTTVRRSFHFPHFGGKKEGKQTPKFSPI